MSLIQLAQEPFVQWFPLYWTVLFIGYIVLKPQSKRDRFFAYNSKHGEEDILNHLNRLEALNNKSYAKAKTMVQAYFADNIITEKEAATLEKMVIRTFYDGFKNRWSAYSKADPLVLITFLIFIAYGFIYVNILFISGPGVVDTTTLIWLNATLIVPVLVFMLMYGVFIVLLQVLAGVFYTIGSVQRANITFSEMIRALKMGGRNTEIKFQGRGSGSFNF